MYYLATLINPDTAHLVPPQWGRVLPADYETQCFPTGKNCVLMKEGSGEKIPLSNSWVSFRSMYFYVSKDYIPKVTINFDMGIAT